MKIEKHTYITDPKNFKFPKKIGKDFKWMFEMLGWDENGNSPPE